MKYKLAGITDDFDSCEICGKTGLKRVMVLEDENGNFTNAGLCCGAKALNVKKATSFEAVQNTMDSRKKFAEAIENAKKLSTQFNDEIGIIKSSNGYHTVRGKAYDAEPKRYGCVIQWVKA